MTYTNEPTRLMMDDLAGNSASFHMVLSVLTKAVPIHWHDFNELSIILAGEGIHRINGVEHKLERGHLMLQTPADFHEIIPKPGTVLEKYNVLFSNEFLSTELFQLLFQDVYNHTAFLQEPDLSVIEADFHRLWREYHSDQEGRMIGIRSTLNRILLDLHRKCPSIRTNEASGSNPFIQNVLIYIHHHFREQLTLEAVATKAKLSSNYFSECFHRETGISFQQYVLDVRLQFGRSLLVSTDLPITEVCLASGFNTLNYFERAFKKKYEYTPSSFRRFSRNNTR
ncbi:helix-turn-helix transcriptional regulator [Paenibacillus sp. FSL H8-0034]|uniref:helix-turn-helix transcriptional regulator n=1 Tax=Paenibacillus sp. FSL H8-0034 TaxID=2954671 RepID=UPI0030F5ED68